MFDVEAAQRVLENSLGKPPLPVPSAGTGAKDNAAEAALAARNAARVLQSLPSKVSHVKTCPPHSGQRGMGFFTRSALSQAEGGRGRWQLTAQPNGNRLDWIQCSRMHVANKWVAFFAFCTHGSSGTPPGYNVRG